MRLFSRDRSSRALKEVPERASGDYRYDVSPSSARRFDPKVQQILEKQ
jgi:hypothetical protein